MHIEPISAPEIIEPVVAIYDKKTGIYTNPFPQRFTQDAVRDFENIKKNQQTKYGKNPEDFDLVHIANFHLRSGKMEMLQPYYTLITGVQNAQDV